MHRQRTRSAVARHRFRAVLLLSSVAFGVLASNATAGVEGYCDRIYSGYESCVGPRHSLTSNLVIGGSDGGSPRVCAGARRGDNFEFYGSFICAGRSACHPYSGDRLLYPVAHNGEPVTFRVRGVQYFGVDRYC